MDSDEEVGAFNAAGAGGGDQVLRSRTAPHASRSDSPSGDSFTSLSKLSVTELRQVAATGSGRNAVRARSLLEKEEGKRLRAGERPADIDVYGEQREKPVRVVDRAKGTVNYEYQNVEANAGGTGRRSPEGSTGRLSPSGSVGTSVNPTMEVIPDAINFGTVRVGQRLRATLNLANTGAEGVRYKVAFGSEGAAGYELSVVELPRGPVAAGIRCVIVVQVMGRSAGEFSNTVKIKSQHDEVTIPIIGTVVEEGDYEAKAVKRDKYVEEAPVV